MVIRTLFSEETRLLRQPETLAIENGLAGGQGKRLLYWSVVDLKTPGSLSFPGYMFLEPEMAEVNPGMAESITDSYR